MATPQWQPGTLYEYGALVLPRTAPAPATLSLQNPGAETGTTGGWDVEIFGGAGTASVSGDKKFTGSFAFRWQGSSGGGQAGGVEATWVNQTVGPVRPGQSVSASAMIALDDTGQSQNQAYVRLNWYDEDDQFINYIAGNNIRGNNSSWRRSSVTATAPAGAAYVRVAVWTTANYSGGIRFDDVQWTYWFTADEGLVYRAVQPAAGVSAANEPAWPPILGEQVIDNEVIWEALLASRVVWQASPILVSGPTEPAWPEVVGSFVADNTINWRVTSRRVEDANCPQSKIVAIASSKVFAGDDDIVRYSATVNPLDWTTADNAGYLPTGLQNYGANPVAAMGLYRGNVIPFNAEAFQLWQVDEDPASMSLLDALPLGSTQHHAIAPVSNDLFFLSSQGVRTVGIAASSTNFQAGDVGMPIDPLVRELVAAGLVPLALYYPAAGQYWLIFPRPVDGDSEVFVYSMTQVGAVGAWSRYVFPFVIEDWAIRADNLYLRSGDRIHRIEDDAVGDEVSPGVIQPFPGVVQWPYLDFGQPGVTKMLIGFDVVGQGDASVQFGYDQSNPAAFTDPYTVPADTVPGAIIPMPLAAPSFAVRLTFDGAVPWQFQAFNLYLQDQRPTA